MKQILAAAAMTLAGVSMTVICLLAVWSVPQFGGAELRKAAAIAVQLRPYLRGALVVEQASQRQTAVNEVLDDALETYPSISAVALVEPQGGRFSRSRDAISEPDLLLGRWLGDTVANRPETVVPLEDGEGPGYRVRIAINRGEAQPLLIAALWDLAIGLVAICLTIWAGLGFLLSRLVDLPLAVFERSREAIERNDWTKRAEPVGPPELKAILTRLNGAVREINERRGRIAWLANEIAIDESEFRERLRGIVGRVAPATSLASVEVLRAPSDAAWPAILLFAGCVADQVGTWMVPVLAASAKEFGLAAALPVAAYFLCAGLVYDSRAAIAGRLNRRVVFGLGCLCSAVGQGISGFAGSFTILCLCRVFSGVGIGAIWVACIAAAAGGPADRAKAFSAAAAGVATGAAVGSLLAGSFSPTAILIVGSVAAAALGVVGCGILPGSGIARFPLERGGAFRRCGLALIVAGFVYALAVARLAAHGLDFPIVARAVMFFALAIMVGSGLARIRPYNPVRIAACIVFPAGLAGGALVLSAVFGSPVASFVAVGGFGILLGVAFDTPAGESSNIRFPWLATGGLIGPVIAGTLSNAIGSGGVELVFAGLLLTLATVMAGGVLRESAQSAQ